ncbi:MAG: SRPBCC family protein [Myxococcota bacterium]|nr:SRPBCC family protein [Myxococcota bacterium]
MKFLSLLAGAAQAQSWNEPPPALDLSAAEISALESGEVIVRQAHEERGSTGSSAALVDGTPQEFWDVVLDFDSYVRFLPYVTQSWTDDPAPGSPSNALRWGMELTTKGVVTRYRIDCLLYDEQDYMVWEMRPTGYSPLAASRGWWRVEPWPADPTKTLVVYQVQVETAWWLPERVHKYAADMGLETTVSQMRRQVTLRRSR